MIREKIEKIWTIKKKVILKVEENEIKNVRKGVWIFLFPISDWIWRHKDEPDQKYSHVFKDMSSQVDNSYVTSRFGAF